MAADQLDRIFDLLAAQGAELSSQGKALAGIAQSQIDTKERLFGTGNTPGVITYLADQHTTLAKEVGTLTLTVSGIKTERRVDKAYVMGASAVLTLAVKGVLSKMGWHF